MSQQEIDERIIELKRRVEAIEQMVGVHSLAPAEQGQFARQTILDALQTVRDVREQVMTKNKNIETYLREHSEHIGFAIKNQSSLVKAMETVNDEVRQIAIHYETIMDTFEKIKEIKKIQEGLEESTVVNPSQKEEALNRRIRDTEAVMFERRRTSEMLCRVLDEYNQLITLLNKRVLYLDHLITLREQAK